MITHEPVLLKEVIENLHIKNQGRYIDATLGAGGYTQEIIKAGGQVLGIDADESMLQIAKKKVGTNATLVHGNFVNIAKLAKENGFSEVDGIVFDLGVSNIHFMDDKRGFSFRNPEAYLDMRLDPLTQSVKASDLLNVLRTDQLEDMFGKSIATKIDEARSQKKFSIVGDFLSLFPPKRKDQKIHPATKAFLMLRIAVNSELENLKEALPQAYELLVKGGRLVVVSFHSLEDEIVKNFQKEKNNKTDFIRPTDEEVKNNPKSRSAILRLIQKL